MISFHSVCQREVAWKGPVRVVRNAPVRRLAFRDRVSVAEVNYYFTGANGAAADGFNIAPEALCMPGMGFAAKGTPAAPAGLGISPSFMVEGFPNPPFAFAFSSFSCMRSLPISRAAFLELSTICRRC